MTSDRSKLSRAAKQKRRRMRRTKHARHLAALVGGYFWLPCQMCGEHYGGHEWQHRISIPAGPHRTTGVCPACELDLGLAAIGMCERDGHQRQEVFGGGRIPFTSDGEGHNIGSIDIDLTTPTSVYCRTCGIDMD